MKSNYTVWRAWFAALALTLLGGCSSLLPPAPPPDNVYLLDGGIASGQPSGATRSKRNLVLAVSMPRARPGFDTAQMVWLRQAHKLEVYSRNRWADTPARMLAPLLAQTLERSGMFQAVVQAVVQAPSAAAAELRLDTELIRLQQDFSVRPSRIQLTLSVQLIDVATRRVIATAEFDEDENATSEDAYGGVLAANRALERLLAKVVTFCVEHAPPP